MLADYQKKFASLTPEERPKAARAFLWVVEKFLSKFALMFMFMAGLVVILGFFGKGESSVGTYMIAAFLFLVGSIPHSMAKKLKKIRTGEMPGAAQVAVKPVKPMVKTKPTASPVQMARNGLNPDMFKQRPIVQRMRRD